MKNTLIITLTNDATTHMERLKTYRLLLNLTKRAIMRTRCKTQARVCLGNFRFLSSENITLQLSPLIHIIVTGKNLDSFYNHFTMRLDDFPTIEILDEFRTKGNAFNRSNNRFIKNISLEEVLLQTNGKPQIMLTEKVTDSFFLSETDDA